MCHAHIFRNGDLGNWSGMAELKVKVSGGVRFQKQVNGSAVDFGNLLRSHCWAAMIASEIPDDKSKTGLNSWNGWEGAHMTNSECIH